MRGHGLDTEGCHDVDTAPLRAMSAAPISSNMVGSSMVAGMLKLAPSTIFFMVPRRIFPERVFGSRATVTAALKAATGPILSRTRSTTSFSIAAPSR